MTASNEARRRGIAVTLASAACFGVYPAAAKVSYATGASPAFMVVWTTFARAAALTLFCLMTKRRVLPEPGRWTPYLTGGFFQAISIVGIIASLVYLPAPVTIIIIFSHTIMLYFLLVFLGERALSTFVVVLTVAALLGLSLVVDVWSHAGELSIRGVSLAFIGAVATASRLYVYGNQVRDEHPIVVGARVFSVAAVLVLSLLFFQQYQAPAALNGWVWTGICSLSLVAGTFGMFYGIAALGSFDFSLMIKLEPVFTALFSVLILHELLRPAQYLGMVIVMCSLLLYQLGTREQSASAAPEE